MNDDMLSWFVKNWPAALLLVAGVLACIATFYSSKQDQEQKESIEQLGTENLKLSNEIKKLEHLNNDISNRIESLSRENIALAEQSKSLIYEVRQLGFDSKDLAKAIDSRTKYESEANIKTSELNLAFTTKTIGDNDDVVVKLGGIAMGHKVKALRDKSARLIMIGDTDPLSISFDDNNQLLFSLKVYDTNGNLIAEIENNNWRPNNNFTGKFNYDNKGFEVMDNKGNIAVSVDIMATNQIHIQGIFPILNGDILICGDNDLINHRPSTAKESLPRVLQGVRFRQLFEYTGKDWLHKRKFN